MVTRYGTSIIAWNASMLVLVMRREVIATVSKTIVIIPMVNYQSLNIILLIDFLSYYFRILSIDCFDIFRWKKL